nr:hypothetical protein CFP56_69681 [Quercus suber]
MHGTDGATVEPQCSSSPSMEDSLKGSKGSRDGRRTTSHHSLIVPSIKDDGAHMTCPTSACVETSASPQGSSAAGLSTAGIALPTDASDIYQMVPW